MKKVKLKDYKGDCVAILDAESVDGIYLVGAYYRDKETIIELE